MSTATVVGGLRPSRASVCVGSLIFLALCGAAFAGPDAAGPASDLALQLRHTIHAMPATSSEIVSALPSSVAFELPWRTALLLLHLFGVVLGFGTALFLDFYLLRHLYWRPVTQSTLELIAFGERLVTVGLMILWFSGLSFLALYYADMPDKLANPKLWAKIAIVCLLTLNGLAIHTVVKPRSHARLGRPILAGETLTRAFPLLAIAGISVSSWLMAFTLGTVRELNFVVPGWLVFAVYGAVLVAAIAAACGLHLIVNRLAPAPTRLRWK